MHNHDEYVILRATIHVRACVPARAVEKKLRLIPDARSKRCMEIPCVLRSVCSAWIFIRPIAMPSPNNARPSFVRAIPSTREIQPRPQLWISLRLHLYTLVTHMHPEYYIFTLRTNTAGYFLPEGRTGWFNIREYETPRPNCTILFSSKKFRKHWLFLNFLKQRKNKVYLRWSISLIKGSYYL